jgi:AmmeMemoRadiSam system protein B
VGLRSHSDVSHVRQGLSRLSNRLTLCCSHSKRVFVLGPSHHVYLDGCALSKCATYKTPLGDLPLDLESELSGLRDRTVLIGVPSDC